MSNQMIKTVDLIYATALVEMAEQAGQLDAVADELQQLGDLLAANADLGRLLFSQILSAEERAGSIDRLFQGQISDLLYRFLRVVNGKDRLGELPGIISAFNKLHAERKGVIDVDAYVASAMDDAKLQSLASAIGAAIGKQVVPHQHVDESLIGGLKLKIGDRLIDGSVAAQLKLMQQKFIEQGRDKAREATAISE